MERHPTRKKIQRELALLLHHEAHVPFGPCGYEELTKFSQAPPLYDYQIILVDAVHSYHGKSFERPLSKQLILLQVTTMSLPVSLGSSTKVMSVPLASNPTTMSDGTDVQTTSSAAPVPTNSALISSTPTRAD